MTTEIQRRDAITSCNRLMADARTLRGRMRALEDMGHGRVEVRHEAEYAALEEAVGTLEYTATQLGERARGVNTRPASFISDPYTGENQQ